MAIKLHDGPLPPYLPFIDPEHFKDVRFFLELERIGYRTILLGGTGGAEMKECVGRLRSSTSLELIAHPSSPGEICAVDRILFPAVMNTNSHFARPFGTGSLACGVAIAKESIPYTPVAYFVLGDSTARWYTDAFFIRSRKLIVSYCLYAKMMRYDWVFLDYEGCDAEIEPAMIQAIKEQVSVKLIVSDEFTPESAKATRALGADVIVTPSNLYEEAADPVALAVRFHDALLGP